MYRWWQWLTRYYYYYITEYNILNDWVDKCINEQWSYRNSTRLYVMMEYTFNYFIEIHGTGYMKWELYSKLSDSCLGVTMSEILWQEGRDVRSCDRIQYCVMISYLRW